MWDMAKETGVFITVTDLITVKTIAVSMLQLCLCLMCG